MNHNIIIKLVSLTLKGIKNVSNGKITFEDYRHLLKGDFTFTHPVSGIYGQNGSGKTAIIEAIKLLRILLMGEKLAKSDINYINYQEKELYLKSQFYLFLNDNHYLISYEFTLKDNQGECEIINEKLLTRCRIRILYLDFVPSRKRLPPAKRLTKFSSAKIRMAEWKIFSSC